MTWQSPPDMWMIFHSTAYQLTGMRSTLGHFHQSLWDYQRKAVENVIKSLWKFYEELQDYQPK